MSRKPTIKTLRAGQTIWYPHRSFASPTAQYEARKVAVQPDSVALPPTYVVGDGFPRWYIRERLAVGGGPEFVSYSRRKVLAWIKARGKVTP